jgi:hypothetical protein
MEAVKNRLTGSGGNARTLVVDPDNYVLADPRHDDFDQPAGRREAYRIVEDGIEGARQPVALARHHRAVLARASKRNAGVAGLPPRFPAAHELFDQLADVDRPEVGAGELGIGSRRLADVANEPVHPCDVVADDARQPVSELRILDPLQPLNRRAQGSQRVLELVADVGGKGFDRIDPLPQRLAHVRNCPRKHPNLVGTIGQAGHVHLA